MIKQIPFTRSDLKPAIALARGGWIEVVGEDGEQIADHVPHVHNIPGRTKNVSAWPRRVVAWAEKHGYELRLIPSTAEGHVSLLLGH